MKLFKYMGKKGLAIFAVACLSMGISVNAAEVLKRDTVFAIDQMSPASLTAFKVSGKTLTDKEQNLISTNQGAAVGLAISTKNKLLFVSYESSGTVDVISAETGQLLSELTIPGTDDIAGIVVSEGRNKLYAVDRDEPHIFVYTMQSDGNVSRVPSEEFDDTDGVWGIDVWGNRLYCTHGKYGPWSAINSPVVSVFDLDTKLKVDEYNTTSETNQAIAVDGRDPNNVMVYTTWAHQGQTASYVTQYNLTKRVEKRLDLGRDGRGLSVNPALNIFYVSTGDSQDDIPPVVRTYDKNTFQLLDEVNLTIGHDPSDLLAVGVTFNPDVTIEITEPADKNVSMCNYVTFTMTVKNPSAEQALIVDGMEDNYDTTEMRFVESSVTPDDTTDDGNITWSNLNQSIAANGSWTFTKRFVALKEENAAHETIKITDAALEGGTPVAFENTIYFDIAYSTAECPTLPEPTPPEPEPEPCCSPELQERDSGSALGTLSTILFAMLTLLAGSLAIRRNDLKQS